MTTILDTTALRLFQFAFVAVALFIPFSIAGTNIALGFVALAWVLSAVARRTGANDTLPRIARVRNDPIFIAAILLAASAIPSVLMSENTSRAWSDWQSYVELIIYFGVAINIAARGMRETTFWVLLASATLSCLVAFIQRAGGIDIGFLKIGAEHRVSSTMFTMTFAGILYQLVVFNLAVASDRGFPGKWRLLIAAAAVIQFVAVVLTMTRGAWIALVAGIFALFLIVRNRLTAIAAAAMLVGLLLFSFAIPSDQSRSMSITGLLRNTADYAVGTRLALWDAAWEMFKSNPLLGVGMGDFSIEAEKILAERAASGDGVRTTTTVDAHNLVLQIMATRGLVGLIPFLFFWYALFRSLASLLRKLERGTLDRLYVQGALAATFAILVGSLTEQAIDDSEVFMAFMFIVGLARSVVYAPRQQPL